MSDFDFEDEEQVLRVMARELDIPEEQLDISEDSGLESFGVAGTVWRIETAGGRKEWIVVESDDAAEELALAVVEQDLDDEPELFTPSFVEQHINIDRLRRDLHSDVSSSNYDMLNDLREDEFWRLADDYGMDVPEEDEDGNLPEPRGVDIEELAERITDNELGDPVRYLQDIYGDTDGIKQAIEIGGIDTKAAAEDAVRTDGAGHFLAHYDGSMHDGPNGIVYWRAN